jgi:hypothetical protein
MNESQRAFLAVLLLVLPGIRLAADEATPPRPQRALDEGLGVSVNRLGLQHTLDLGWTRPLTASANPLLADAHLAFGLSHSVTPAYTRLGAWVEVSPLSILDVRAGAEAAAYFGTFGSLMSFGSYGQRFDDTARNARKGDGRPGTGSRLYLAPTLKMKVGPLVAVTGGRLEWWRTSAAGPLYYEPARDTLLKVGGDRILTTSTLLLRQLEMGRRGSVSYGLSHNLNYVFDAPENRSQRVGVVAVRQFGPRRFRLNAPRIGVEVSYYVSDPSRKGQFTAAVGMSIGLAR